MFGTPLDTVIVPEPAAPPAWTAFKLPVEPRSMKAPFSPIVPPLP